MRDKFYVNFRASDSVHSSEVARFDSLEEAVSLALALHRSSNISHTVCVVSYENCETELTLRFSDDA